MLCAKQRWSVTVTDKGREKGITRWIDEHKSKVKAVTFKRCVFSPIFNAPKSFETLKFLYCRVSPYAFGPLLRHLVIHQLVAGEHPGCMTPLLNECPLLEKVSVTFTSWGIVSIGPLVLPHLTDLELFHPGILHYHHGETPTLHNVKLHAEDLETSPEDGTFPTSCTHLSLRSTTSFLYLDACIPESLESLDITTKGMVYPTFLRHLHAIRKFTCQCDSYIVEKIPGSLVHFEVDVTLCFVCYDMSEEEVRRFQTIPFKKTSERHVVFDLIPFLMHV